VVASLDDLVENWPSSASDTENAAESSSDRSGAQELLGSLKPLAGLVRDHQAFLIPDSQGRDDLRDVLNRFRPGRGTITVGGLDAERQVDHLVAMMMMDAAGLDHTAMKYRQYESMDTLARALLADEVQLLSIPVSTAIQLPLSEGLAMVAFTGQERLDVIIDTPTLVELQYDMTFTNYIGLYEQGPVGESTSSTSPGSVAVDLPDLSAQISWPDQLYSLGLVDDYVNEGVFTANVLQQLSALKDFQSRIDS
jgi:putative tricarboxylic transport membrane protein